MRLVVLPWLAVLLLVVARLLVPRSARGKRGGETGRRSRGQQDERCGVPAVIAVVRRSDQGGGSRMRVRVGGGHHKNVVGSYGGPDRSHNYQRPNQHP